MRHTRTADRRALRASNERRCRRLLELSAPLATHDLAWDDVGSVEVPASVLDTLVYMRDVEGFTDSYLVGVGAHRTTLADPLVRRFLDVWQEEEAGHSQALARYLDLYGARRGVDVAPRQPSPVPSVSVHERLVSRVGGPVGRLIVAAHMAWGAANELLTLNGYRLLAGRCEDPVLVELLGRIAAQESRHYSFYLLQAEWRLARSGLARRALARVLRSSWTPVGVGEGYKSHAEFDRVLGYLGVGADGERAIARMDRRFSALPGFDGLRIYAAAAAAA